MEAERIPRSRFRNVKADSHSEIILVTDEGSPATESDDPTARAAYESLRFLKFPRNCNKCKNYKKRPSNKIHGRTNSTCSNLTSFSNVIYNAPSIPK
ncbi:hypothetical protein C1H46_004024 [Malus baccata]|uniref:Uncharacterized protein n=1 Tax=Malus baccata TaxID=106549 RepID=A0A540NHA6_MALBA|nr:hypothetical protein C1H46_004024 [Malus baccata]